MERENEIKRERESFSNVLYYKSINLSCFGFSSSIHLCSNNLLFAANDVFYDSITIGILVFTVENFLPFSQGEIEMRVNKNERKMQQTFSRK